MSVTVAPLIVTAIYIIIKPYLMCTTCLTYLVITLCCRQHATVLHHNKPDNTIT